MIVSPNRTGNNASFLSRVGCMRNQCTMHFGASSPERVSSSSQVDLGLYGHAQPQQVLRVLAGFEDDLDGNPLHHLDVIPGRVLRREYAEERTGRAGDVENVSLIGAAIGIDGDLHFLS